ncbi:MAG: large conductance mechanosensitive channel protein MscL [Candidatus Doudnabacteria bacterium]|nr:large conductance mechanosensitive channel protein MscL [Candidatus Doudnabacteria bacterium]
MWKEFKEFAIKGNALDLAVGVIIGAAFTTVVNSIVNDIINPILDVFIGRVDLKNLTIGLPGDAVLRFGSFLNATFNFLIVAFAVFLLVKQINRFRRRREDAPNTKECPYCLSLIPLRSTKCAHCTSEIN